MQLIGHWWVNPTELFSHFPTLSACMLSFNLIEAQAMHPRTHMHQPNQTVWRKHVSVHTRGTSAPRANPWVSYGGLHLCPPESLHGS